MAPDLQFGTGTAPNLLREMRWARALSAQQCASLLGLDVFDYVRLERGNGTFSPEQIERLEQFLRAHPVPAKYSVLEQRTKELQKAGR